MKILAFGILFLALELGLIAFLVRNMIKKRKFIEKSDVFYIVPVFILVWGMHIIALLFNNSLTQTPVSLMSILSLAKTALECFVLTFDMALLEPIMTASILMYLAYAIAFVLTSLTTILTFVFLIKNMFFNFIKKLKVIFKNGDIVFGLSEDSKKYNKQNPTSIIWDDKINNSTYKDLISKNYIVYHDRLTEKSLFAKIKKGSHHLILFKDSNYDYSYILNLFKKVINIKNQKTAKMLEKTKIKLTNKLKRQNSEINKKELDALINKELEKIKSKNSIYLHIESILEEMEAIQEEFASYDGTNLNSFVTCFNKYQNLAIDFVKEYPISYYTPRQFFNNNYSLKNDKKINIVFVGFGNVNLELFKMMAMNFNFAKQKTTKNGYCKFKNEPINFYCYDNNDDKLCNDIFTKLDYEYFNDFKNTNLPEMEKICNLHHQKINVYSSEIKQNIESIANENSYTYIIVSLKSDLENIAYAENLQGYLTNKPNFKIFTRVKESVFYNKQKTNRSVEYFGEEEKLYSHDIITNKSLIKLAQSIKSAHAEKLSNDEEFKWHNLKLIHQYSKIYLALSMFFKIGLMGYKLTPNNNLQSKNICTIDSVIKNFSHIPAEEMKKNYMHYFNNKASNLMAFVEHSRWNAHYYLSGYKPMGINEFAPKDNNAIGNLKTFGVVKKHSSLTSYDGLDVLFKYIYLMQKYGNNYYKYNIKDITTEELNSEQFRKIEQFYYDYRMLDFINNIIGNNYVLIK